MDERLQKLLGIVVEDVIETGEPVGSQRLVDAHKLEVSPATVRNWFAELESAGFIAQPHTSSGRIPTEKGYRLYVEEIMQRRPLAKRELTDLKNAAESQAEAPRKVKAVAKMSAELAESAVVVGLGDADTFYTGLSHLFSQPEFRDWQRMVDLGQILDRLDDVLLRVRQQQFLVPTVLIGADCPFGNACSSLMLTARDGTLFGLLGPLRMDYVHGIALLDAAKELLNA
ncbi:MAG: hypothetical protein WA001_04445 [Patescibacteria group bacterium]